jgi:hypothetical protein
MIHVHRYSRVDIGRDKEYWVMKCTLPKCNHYTAMASKLRAPLLVGRTAICNKCMEEFTLNRRALRMAAPICDRCVGTRVNIEIKKANDFFEELEKDLKK